MSPDWWGGDYGVSAHDVFMWKKKSDAYIKKVAAKAPIALTKAAFLIQREAQKKCPVDTGNLKASAFTIIDGLLKTTPGFGEKKTISVEAALREAQDKERTQRILREQTDESRKESERDKRVDARVGFTASYAIFVHELHPSKAKFLEEAVRENKGRIKNLILAELKGKST